MHLTDDQLNEYLDHESLERSQIEAHLAACEACAMRLAAFELLFSEIESLPEVELSSPLVLHIPIASPLPRWLTLTATLQVALALLTAVLAAPFITELVPAIEPPSPSDAFLALQVQWTTWLHGLFAFQVPIWPKMPDLDISSLMLMLTLTIVSIVWLVGNGLLLKRQLKS